jgi:hypothetical protein
MKVNTGPYGATQASGAIGGQVYSHNRYGMFMRAHTMPVKPRTSYQITYQTALTNLSHRWSVTLTPTQRAAWQVYAAAIGWTGRGSYVFYLTGMQHFIRSNSMLAANTWPLVDDGPVILALPDKDLTIAVAASEATQLLTITFNAAGLWNIETGGRMWVKMSRPQAATRNFWAGPWRHVHTLNGNAGSPPASPATTGVLYPIAQGQKVFCEFSVSRADGRLSTPFQAACTVGA